MAPTIKDSAKRGALVGFMAVSLALAGASLPACADDVPDYEKGGGSAASQEAGTNTESSLPSMTADDALSVARGNQQTVDATDNDMLSASDAYKALESHGFTDMKLTVNFDKNGDFIQGGKEVAKDSTDSWPFYKGNYTTSSGYTWAINVTKYGIGAILLSAPSGSLTDMVALSETESYVEYDGVDKIFIHRSVNDGKRYGIRIIPNTEVTKTVLDDFKYGDGK